jgi:alpha-mannosidase
VGASDILRSERDHKDVERCNQALLLFGHGDGGGGPTYEMLDKFSLLATGKMSNHIVSSQANLSGKLVHLPRLSMASPQEFFDDLKKDAHKLLSWRGELYFELHRGTYTSHARTKYYNRRCETLLREAEMLSFVLGTISGDLKQYYPLAEFENLWKGVLLNQFHDVLPGSSIGSVYNDSTKIYENVEFRSAKIRDTAMNALFGNHLAAEPWSRDHPEKTIVLFNTTPYRRSEVMVVPWDGHGSDERKTPQPGVIAVNALEGFSMASLVDHEFTGDSNGVKVYSKEDGYYLDNQFVKVHVDNTGHIVSMFDKEHQREIIQPKAPGNRFMLYEDIPFFWDAWDTELYHREKGRCVSEDQSKVHMEVAMKGPLLVSLNRVIQISPQSTVHQVISLSCLSRRLDFTCRVEWHETHQFLKVDFPLIVQSDYASFECPFGLVRRPTHRNTSWDVARFEVCGHRFADLSESNYGVALLNDCKYGYAAYRNCLSLSLLRSPKSPDPNCDMGQHVMRFALFPHPGDVVTGAVVEEAVKFNTALLWTAASPKLYDHRWLGKSFLQFVWAHEVRIEPSPSSSTTSGTAVISRGISDAATTIGCPTTVPLAIEVIKVAEDGINKDGFVVIRAYEPVGNRGEARLVGHPLLRIETLEAVDLLERPLSRESGRCPIIHKIDETGEWSVSFAPFQIVSLLAKIVLAPDALPPRKGDGLCENLPGAIPRSSCISTSDKTSISSFEII